MHRHGPSAARQADWAVFVALLFWLFPLSGLAQDRAAGDAPAPPVRVEIASPATGETVENDVDMAPIRGTATSGSEGSKDFDVMIAVDVSHSTRLPSGIDIDGDGEVGFNPKLELVAPGAYPDDMVCTDADDHILAAEIRAAGILVGELDPKHTRLGVITFSGEVDPETGRRVRADQKDAKLAVPLTTDFSRVLDALEAIREEGPHGATNFSAAEQLAVRELSGLPGAKSRPEGDRKKVLLFLTDGKPTLPIGTGNSQDPGDTDAAIQGARLARKAGVTIHTFALGQNALAGPIAVKEMARLTSGTFTPVRNPGQIAAFLQGVSFTDIEDVVIRNLTTDEVSFDVSVFADGRFSGFVSAKPGVNRVRVTALASDGSEGSKEVEFDFKKSGLTKLELSRELERIKARNKELLLLLERKRIQDFRDRQRKEVLIESKGRD